MRESLDASRLGKTLNTMQNIKVFINVTMLKNRNFCSSKNKKTPCKKAKHRCEKVLSTPISDKRLI